MTAEKYIRRYFAGYESMDDAARRQRLTTFLEETGKWNDMGCFARIWIAAVFEGTDSARLASLLDCDLETVRQVAERMIASKLWSPDGSVHYESLKVKDEEIWLCGLVLEVGVAVGLFIQVGKDSKGRNTYKFAKSPSGKLSRIRLHL